jgi:hypothetical protein
MDTPQQELERAFLNLRDLKHIGMALMQYAIAVSADGSVMKTEAGGFRVVRHTFGFVEFSFPEGPEKIRMHVNFDPSQIEGLDGRFLPVRDSCPYPVCDIVRPNQLASAARYIEAAERKYLGTRFTNSSGFDQTVN